MQSGEFKFRDLSMDVCYKPVDLDAVSACKFDGIFHFPSSDDVESWKQIKKQQPALLSLSSPSKASPSSQPLASSAPPLSLSSAPIVFPKVVKFDAILSDPKHSADRFEGSFQFPSSSDVAAWKQVESSVSATGTPAMVAVATDTSSGSGSNKLEKAASKKESVDEFKKNPNWKNTNTTC